MKYHYTANESMERLGIKTKEMLRSSYLNSTMENEILCPINKIVKGKNTLINKICVVERGAI